MRLSALLPDGERREVTIEDLWPHKSFLVLKFEGVATISDGERLLRAELQVPRRERAQLEPGWTYLSDLIGCKVFDGSGPLGDITVGETPVGEILVGEIDVRFGAGEAPLLVVKSGQKLPYEIPFAEAYIEKVDLERREIHMRLPEGLLEVNAPLVKVDKARKSEKERKARNRRAEETVRKDKEIRIKVWSAMKIDILTIFPEFFRGPLDYGIVRRARETGLVEIRIHDLREFAKDKHRTVDDRPFGGGEGMVLKPEPIFECLESLGNVAGRQARLQAAAKQSVILLSPQGQRLDQNLAERISELDSVVLICGRYEGVDERISEHLADREVSIGDYVLSGGELGAAVIVDTVTRLLPGAVGNRNSTRQESFSAATIADAEFAGAGPLSTCVSGGLLDYPHYTRPAEYRGMAVPEVLVNGNHQQIRNWRRKTALAKTLRNRPDLLERVALTSEDEELLAQIKLGGDETGQSPPLQKTRN